MSSIEATSRRLLGRTTAARCWVVGVVGGLVAAFAGAAPVQVALLDAGLVIVAVASLTRISASARWWACALAAYVSCAIAFDPIIIAIGAAACTVSLGSVLLGRDSEVTRAVVTAIALNVLIRSDLEVVLGLSAFISLLVVLVLVASSVAAQRRPSRRVVAATGSACVLVAGAVVGGLALAGRTAASDVRGALQLSRTAVDDLNSGDYAGAADRFEQSSILFERGHGQVDGVLAWPARFVPALAQNVTAGVRLSRSAADATARASQALRQIDQSALRVTDGAIDLDALAGVEVSLVDVADALADLRRVSAEVDSPWLVGPLRSRLDEFDDEYDRRQPLIQNALDAVRLAPGLLGADGTRRYLLLFTTPAEARGLGGFVGNFAEAVVTDGQVSISEFGRRSDLEDALGRVAATCESCPDELLDFYGRFGLRTGPTSTVDRRVWSNITMPAHFPYVATAAADLYPQSGGDVVDGVLVLDPYVLQVLMGFTGPVVLPELNVTVQPNDAANFILRDQYLGLDDGADESRIDGLEQLGAEVTSSLLSGSLPEPSELARLLGPLIAERRLLMWTSDAEEQELFDRTGLLGALPEPVDGGFSVSMTNTGASKIDVFLERTVDLREQRDGDDRRLVATVGFTNSAPSSGLPDYVIGNSVGLPPGSSRLLVTFYGNDELISGRLDGREIALEQGEEAGWVAHRHALVLGPGESAEYELVYELGQRPDLISTPGPRAQSWEQPLSDR